MQSPNNAPPGGGIIHAEVYFPNKYQPLDRTPEDCIMSVVDDLKRCDPIDENEEILFADAKVIPYANVVFDLDRSAVLSLIQEYLKEIGIYCCGR